MADVLWDSGLISQSSTTISHSSSIALPGSLAGCRLWAKCEGSVGGNLSQFTYLQQLDPFGDFVMASTSTVNFTSTGKKSGDVLAQLSNPRPATIRFEIQGAGAVRYKLLASGSEVEVANPSTAVRITNSTSQRVPVRIVCQ